MQTLLIIVGAYILYKVIVDFVIPIYRTTKRVQEQFRSMQETARNQHMSSSNGAGYSQPTQPPPSSQPKEISKEYIDFEEIKD